jgi:transposase, IS30 family
MATGRRSELRKMLANPQLASLVIEKLKEVWSPEHIAGHLRVVSQTAAAVVSKVSRETIYRYVYDQTGRELDLDRQLPAGRPRRRRRFDCRPRGLHIPQANTIIYRCDVINERQPRLETPTWRKLLNAERGYSSWSQTQAGIGGR